MNTNLSNDEIKACIELLRRVTPELYIDCNLGGHVVVLQACCKGSPRLFSRR